MNYKHIIIFILFLLIIFILFSENFNIEAFENKMDYSEFANNPKKLYDQENTRNLKERINKKTDQEDDEKINKELNNKMGWNKGFPEIVGEERYSTKIDEWHGIRGPVSKKGNWSWLSKDSTQKAENIFNNMQNDNRGNDKKHIRDIESVNLPEKGDELSRKKEKISRMEDSKYFNYTDWGQDGKDIDE